MSELSALNGKVQSALENLFLQHRLVFWYDDKAVMKELFDAIKIQEIAKVVIENNEFTLKHRVLIAARAALSLGYTIHRLSYSMKFF